MTKWQCEAELLRDVYGEAEAQLSPVPTVSLPPPLPMPSLLSPSPFSLPAIQALLQLPLLISEPSSSGPLESSPIRLTLPPLRPTSPAQQNSEPLLPAELHFRSPDKHSSNVLVKFCVEYATSMHRTSVINTVWNATSKRMVIHHITINCDNPLAMNDE
jgi:hypothetical protein